MQRSTAGRRGAACEAKPARGDGGYLSIDAMVALLIIALTTVLALNAVQQAGRLATAAEEIRQAQVLLSELLDNGPKTYLVSQGVSSGFAWTVETQVTGPERPIAVCRRVITLTNSRSQHFYQTSTLEACPPEEGA